MQHHDQLFNPPRIYREITLDFLACIGAALVLSSATLLTACVSTMPSKVSSASPDVIRALAPSGTLRAAINFGNPILANKNAQTGEPYGVSVDIARELG